MKAGKCTTAILIIVSVFASCSKDKTTLTDNASQQAKSSASATSPGKATYISEWESGYSWNTSDSAGYKMYRYDKSISQLTADIINTGAVLMFAKNYPDDNGVRVTIAQKLPFSVIPEFGRPAYNSFWYYMLTAGNATVKFRSNKYQYANGPEPLPDSNVQFRYIVLSASDLRLVGKTQSSIQNLNYDELVNLLGTGF